MTSVKNLIEHVRLALKSQFSNFENQDVVDPAPHSNLSFRFHPELEFLDNESQIGNVSDSNKTQQSLEKKVRKITVVLEVVAGFLINFQLKIPTIIIGHLRILGYLNAYLKVFGPILTWSVSN